jgi:hypothetical protein
MLILLCGLTSCSTVGHNFVAPSQHSFLLGQTTKAEILNQFGTPEKEENVTRNGETVERLQYQYQYAESPASPVHHDIWKIIRLRMLEVYLWKQKLVGYIYLSNFKEDSTCINDNTANLIKKGQSKEEVIRIIGLPRSKMIYPLINNREGEAYEYYYKLDKINQLVGFTAGGFAELRKSSHNSETLLVEFDVQGIVSNVSYKTNGDLSPSCATPYYSRPNLKPSNDKATLVLFGDSYFWNYIDGKFIGLTNRKSYLITQVNPGKHYLVVATENIKAALIDFEPGRIYYLREGTTMGLFQGRASGFYPMTPQEAKDAMDRRTDNWGGLDMETNVGDMDHQRYQQAIADYNQEIKDNPQGFKDILDYNGY